VIGAMLVAIPALMVAGEGLNTTPHPLVPDSPLDWTSLSQPVLVLPTHTRDDYMIMLWSVQGWPVIANGDSGFDPLAQADLRRQVQGFPDAASVDYLKAHGVATVVVIRAPRGHRLSGKPALDPTGSGVAGLEVGRTSTGDTVVYRIQPP
jgi:hypothetical protein